MAQGTTGSITGTVTDATGAIIPGATVTITKIATNAVHTIQTSDAGTYTVPQLQPGQYTVKVEMAGFKAFEQKSLTLLIDQVVQVDAVLTVGSQGEVVEVTDAPPVVQTSNSSVGLVVDKQAITNIPLNGRLGLMGLIALAPGVQGAGAQDQLATRGVTAAVGTGARNSYGGLGSTLDGVSNQEVTLQRGEGEVPSLGAIAEFKVLTNGAPAEFNQPSQIVVVSASGTNKLHGKLLEYNRSKGMGAKTYYGGSLPRPPYERNEYAVHLEGPITIPHVYSGHDRSFFFFAFEGFKLTQSNNDNTIQPTLLERAGNFSEFLAGGVCAAKDKNGNSISTYVINSATGLPYPGNIIPSTSINSVDQQLLNLLYPKPTTSGCGTNTFELVQEKSNATRTSVRIDHRISAADQLRFTYLRAFYGPSPTNGTDSLQGGNSLDGEHNQNYIVGWTHTFTPSLLLDTAGSYFHLPIYRTPQNAKFASSIIPGLGTELIEGAPTISITNITGVGESGSKDLEQDAQINTSLTKVLAKHTIKAGFSYLYSDHWNDSASGPQRGSYTFNGQYTSSSSPLYSGAEVKSGIAFADFFLGDPSSTQAPSPNNYFVRNVSSQYGFYVQDDWKLRPNLTINAGIRYDLQRFDDNPYNHNSLYIPSLKKMVVFGKSIPSDAIASYLTAIPVTLASSVGLPSNVWSYLGQPTHNIAPRLGFAYEAVPNTVIRGAFGLYFNLLPSSYADSAAFGNLPFLGTETFTNSTSTPVSTPSFTMSDPFGGTGAFASHPTATAQHKTENPYTEEYNIALEHQFKAAIDIRIGYTGQHNLKQNNYGGPGNTAPNINLANPPQVGVSVQSTNLVQPFAGIGLNFDPIFHSSENSLQLGLHKQYSHGRSLGVEYQWTRVLGIENIENPSAANVNDSYGPISGITPQVLAANYAYTLPTGKGQLLFKNASPLVDKVVSGWQITGITSIQTGQPFSVTYSAPGSPTGLVSGRADRVPGAKLYPANKTNSEWFNTAAFSVPLCYNSTGTGSCTSTSFFNSSSPTTYALYGNSGYDALRGPAFQDWDLNLEKNTSFHERYQLQLRADSFNIFNHPDFAPPNAAINNSSSFGTISAISSTPTYEPRTVEFAIKFSF